MNWNPPGGLLGWLLILLCILGVLWFVGIHFQAVMR